MRTAIYAVGLCLLATQPLAEEETPLPPAPEGYIELAWSAQFASVLVHGCSHFALKEWDPRIVAFMDSLVEDGVDLVNGNAVYAPYPNFDGAAAKFLIEKSDIADEKLSLSFYGCELAELVFRSDMLAAAMLMRIEAQPGS